MPIYIILPVYNVSVYNNHNAIHNVIGSVYMYIHARVNKMKLPIIWHKILKTSISNYTLLAAVELNLKCSSIHNHSTVKVGHWFGNNIWSVQNNIRDNFLFIPIHNKLVVSVDVQNVVKLFQLDNKKLVIYALRFPVKTDMS